jgi:hypothetical protein
VKLDLACFRQLELALDDQNVNVLNSPFVSADATEEVGSARFLSDRTPHLVATD